MTGKSDIGGERSIFIDYNVYTQEVPAIPYFDYAAVLGRLELRDESDNIISDTDLKIGVSFPYTTPLFTIEPSESPLSVGNSLIYWVFQ